MKKLRTLLVYQHHRRGIVDFYESHIKRLRDAGFDVEGFCITIDPPAPRIAFSALERMWRRDDSRLQKLYAELIGHAREMDVLVLYNGANLHPELLADLSTFNAYMCFDDPESSEELSKPVARFFDAAFVGNIASLEQYKAWGCKNIFFRPLGWFAPFVDQTRGPQERVTSLRELDACLFCERESDWRRQRIESLERMIPTLYGRGRGWPEGYASDEQMLDVYRRSKIGINLHNSTGPINMRTYTLPANGLMQICDNKYHLGQIFELGKEVVGYTAIEELPELVSHYLRNDAERERIALAGCERALRDYNEIAVWRKQMEQIEGLL